jgi:hypothetical protein
MKRFLMPLVFAAVFMATSTQAANGKIYFADSAELSIPDDLDFPGLNTSFILGYSVDDALGYDMGRFRAGSIEVDEVNGIASPIDSDLTGLTFMTKGYYDIETAISSLSLYTGSGLGLAGIEIDGGAFDSAGEEDLGYQFRVELGFNVSQTTVLTAEYRYLGSDEPNVLNPHGFVFGARFLY